LKRKKQLKITNESGSLEVEEVSVEKSGNDEKNKQDTLEISVEKIITTFLNNNNNNNKVSSLAVPLQDLSALMLISKKVLRSKSIDTDKATMTKNNNNSDENDDNNLKVAELLKLINQLADRLHRNADVATKYPIN